MRTASNVLLLSLATMVLFTRCEKEPQFDPNDPIDFKDEAFLNALIEEGVDSDGDNLISYVEAEAVSILYLDDEDISDLSGIETFSNLLVLYCEFNALTHLDVSNNISLGIFSCSANQLTSLDVSLHTALQNFQCADNQLTTIDISNNPLIWHLECSK